MPKQKAVRKSRRTTKLPARLVEDETNNDSSTVPLEENQLVVEAISDTHLLSTQLQNANDQIQSLLKQLEAANNRSLHTLQLQLILINQVLRLQLILQHHLMFQLSISSMCQQ